MAMARSLECLGSLIEGGCATGVSRFVIAVTNASIATTKYAMTN
jgi:hypothetical protein